MSLLIILAWIMVAMDAPLWLWFVFAAFCLEQCAAYTFALARMLKTLSDEPK